MPLLSDADLAQARAAFTDELSDFCDIQRNHPVRGSGGVRDVWTTLATDLPCRFANQPQGQAEREIAGRLAQSVDGRLALPALTDITSADRVVVRIDGATLGTFSVTYSSGRRSNEMTTYVFLTKG